MKVSTDVVLGIDIGTTSSKAVARSAAQDTCYVEQPTPWHTSSCGQTEIDPYHLVDVAVDLIGRAVRTAERAWGPVPACAASAWPAWARAACSSTQPGEQAAPVIAWFDHRGGHELEQVGRESPGFAATFERTTGLRWSSQASLAKLLWLRASGYRARARRPG